MKLVYPACFYPEENGQYSVIFPDFGNATYGNSLDDALAMAEDLLGGMYALHKEDGDPLPDPSPIDSVVADEYPNGFVTLVHVDGDAYMKTHPTKTPKQLKLEKVTKFNDWVYRHLAWVNIALLVLLVLSWALPAYISHERPSSMFALLRFNYKTMSLYGVSAEDLFCTIVFCVSSLAQITVIPLFFRKKSSVAAIFSIPACLADFVVIELSLGFYSSATAPHVGFYLALLIFAFRMYQIFLICTRAAKLPAEPTTEKNPPQD